MNGKGHKHIQGEKKNKIEKYSLFKCEWKLEQRLFFSIYERGIFSWNFNQNSALWTLIPVNLMIFT